MRTTIRIALLGATVLMGSQAGAAVVTGTVTGVLDTFQWKWGLSQYQWNDFFAGSQAQFDAALAQGNTGYTTQRGTFNPFAIPLTGTITYDNVTGAVSALTVTQVGTLAGLRPISNLDFGTGPTPYQLYSTDAEVSYSGFSWTLGSNGLGQTLELQGLDNLLGGPTVNYCVSHFIVANGACDDAQGFYRPFIGHLVGNGTGSNDPLNSADDALGNESLMDFDGIPAGFNPGGAAPFAATAGATFNVVGTTLNVDLYSQSGLLVSGGSSAGRAHMLLTIQPADTDADGVPDHLDNCKLRSNANQCNSDGDAFGNRCDGDLNNNGSTNAQDTTLFRQQLGQPSVGPVFNKADINCNGAVNAQDTTLFRGLLGSPPGP